jgi:hypothetical protein
MSVIEAIVRGVQTLPLPEQVEVARYVHRLSTSLRSERAAALERAQGALDAISGEAFDEALREARRTETHG